MRTFSHIYLLMVLILCSIVSYGQDTIKKTPSVLPEIDVTHYQRDYITLTDLTKAAPHYIISKELLVVLGAVDMGDALKYLPSVQIRDYGGVGGVKTVSYRSLGASHTGVVLDNNLQLNSQTGAINLSAFETFGMESVEFTSGQPASPSALASSYLPASVISVNTSLMAPDTAFGVKFYQNISTINAFESAILVQTPFSNNGFIAAQGFAKYGSGKYKYKYNLSGSDEDFIRQNSDILNTKVRIGGGYTFNKLKVTASIYHNKNQQQLPGAVVLYNPSNDQKLSTESIRADFDLKGYSGKLMIRTNAFYQSNNTRYEDPSFLNAAGFLTSNYNQINQGLGAIISRFVGGHNQRVFVGADGIFSQLLSSEFTAQPSRLRLNSVIGFKKIVGRLNIEGNVSHQLIMDKARLADSIGLTSLNKLSPYFAISVDPLKKIALKIRAYYKHAFRLPTFNDLYYNYIGNTNLKPEEAHLTNIGLIYSKWFGKRSMKSREGNRLELTLDGYFNRVQNKIVAIPTKDLFNWSMQNIGKTEALGIDLSASFVLQKKDWKFTFISQHSVNKTIDITDINGPTFGHQIPYTPKYTTTSTVLFGYKGYVLNTNIIFSGSRYSLNENITANYLNAYTDLNIGVKKEFKFRNDMRFLINMKAMNILNKNYEIIRSFPMPGRYYQLTLNFSYK